MSASKWKAETSSRYQKAKQLYMKLQAEAHEQQTGLEREVERAWTYYTLKDSFERSLQVINSNNYSSFQFILNKTLIIYRK